MATKKISVNVYSQAGEKVSTVSLLASVFGVEVNKQVMFDAVQVYQANLRQATSKTKTRSEVSGGGKKPFRQKGTGRARAGSTRTNIWVGGGVVFGPDGKQNYKLRQNKKEHALALKSALTLKGKEGLLIIDEIKVEGKTKEAVNLLKAFKVEEKKILLVTTDEALIRSSRNLGNVITRPANNICVYELLNVDHVIINKEDIKKVEEALA